MKKISVKITTVIVSYRNNKYKEHSEEIVSICGPIWTLGDLAHTFIPLIATRWMKEIKKY